MSKILKTLIHLIHAKEIVMKTLFNFYIYIAIILLLTFSEKYIIAQTYNQFPINLEDKFAIVNMDIYENQVAIVGRIRFENKLKVYLFKDNQWTALPMTVNVNGEERFIGFENKNSIMRSNIQFDQNGTIWIIGIDGLYSFENNQWIRHSLKNVRDDLTTYNHFVFDKQGRIWVVVRAVVTTGNVTKGGFRLYKYENSEFTQFIEQYSFYPDDFPLINVSELNASKDVKNTGALSDGVILFGDKRFLYMGEDGIQTEIAYVKSDGSAKFMEIPIIDKPIYSGSLKKLNRIFVDSKERVFFLMRYQEGFNQNTGVLTQCCSGIARLDNGTDWYTYTQDNNTPYSERFHDYYTRYATPLDMCELKNNEYLFVMQNNGYTEPKNLQLYKLNNQDKFDTLQWKSYLENATIYRSDYTLISEENLKISINNLMNQAQVPSILNISGMKTDSYGNVWMYGESFLIKMTDDPMTSVAESIQKPTVIYPNPGNKSIRLSNRTNDITKTEILNVTGTVVRTVMENSMEIPISEFTNGMYFVKIYAQNGNIEVLKFIKN